MHPLCKTIQIVVIIQNEYLLGSTNLKYGKRS